jgi:hypothetical protein
MRRIATIAVILSFQIVFLPAAKAETTCVTNTLEFQDALNKSVINAESDLIRVTEGFYSVQAPLQQLSSDSFAVTIEGGYQTVMGVPCAGHIKRPTLTILDGGDANTILQIRKSAGSGNLTIRDLTVQHGLAGTDDPPLILGGAFPWSGNLTIERLVVRENRSSMSTAQFSSGGGTAKIHELAFINNETSGLFSALVIAASPGVVPVALTNITVAGNRVFPAGPGSIGMIGLFGEGADYILSNNIFWGNAGTDLRMDSASFTLVNNDIGSRTGVVVGETGSISMDPHFLASNDYRLAGNSPARDAGTNSPQGGLSFLDARGAERVVFGTVDMGAYEIQDELFSGTFE